MSYFIFDGVLKNGKEFELEKHEAKHLLKSRRLREGEHFLIQDKSGHRFEALILRCHNNKLSFVLESSVNVPPPSCLRLEILQALTKEKALDWILQKSTELGVNRLDIFCGTHSPNSFQNLVKRKQLVRWNRIVLEASKQCGRQFPPEIFCHENLEKTLKTIAKCENSWILSPGTENPVTWRNLSKDGNNSEYHRIIVGPEGGFHKDEIDLALLSGGLPVNLGPRIMRSETAAISAVSILQFLLGDLK